MDIGQVRISAGARMKFAREDGMAEEVDDGLMEMSGPA